MEIDTGSAVSVVPRRFWEKELKEKPLQKCATILKTVTGERVGILGQTNVRVSHKSEEVELPILVMEGEGPTLLGRNWLLALKIDWTSVYKTLVTTKEEELIAQYGDLFKQEIGTLEGFQAKLAVDTPKFYKPRAVPYAIRDAVEDRMERLGIVERVHTSEWASPIVPVPKADGSIRICGDFKVTINPVLEVDQYPLPRPEDIFSTLAGGQRFSKLDLASAYQQLILDESSRQYVTVNTHKGLYRYTRLPFGVASAPAVFQNVMENGLTGVCCYLDDILVMGKTDEEHYQNLKAVLDRLQAKGLRLRRSKCQFFQTAVEYLGFRITQAGLSTLPCKVEAVLKAPTPRNVTELKSFLGLVNYYGRFLANLSSVCHPLNRLLQKEVKWTSSEECEKSFERLKESLVSAQVLMHYDVSLLVRLACDASAYGIGAVISHVLPSGEERPVAYASRSLSKAEVNYSQIEKEALALIFGVRRFHQFLYGRKFVLVTDHKPLVTIFGSKQSIPPIAAARLQRWSIILAGYRYEIEYKRTQDHSNADGLSRLPVGPAESEEVSTKEAGLFNLSQIKLLPVTSKELAAETRKDPIFSRVTDYIINGWPSRVDTGDPIHETRATDH